MNRNMVVILMSLVLGVILGCKVDIDIIMILSGIVVLSIFIFFRGENKYRCILVFLLFGMIISNLNERSYILDKDEKTTSDIIGVVYKVEKVYEGYSKYILDIKRVNGKPYKKRILLKHIGSEVLSEGNTVQARGRFKSGKINTNPGLFNEKRYLKSKKIFGVFQSEDVDIVDKSVGLKDKFRRLVEDKIDGGLSERNGRLMKSIILADTDYIEEDRDLYSSLGLSHLLAVSGLHIEIISGFLLAILYLLRVHKKLAYPIVLSLVLFYGYLVSFPPSMVRGMFMLGLYYLSIVICEPYDGLNALCVTCFGMIVYNPFIIYNVGFQLSVVCTFSIHYIWKNLRLYFKGTFSKVLLLPISINLGILPLQIYYFNRFSLYSIISNIVIVPIVSLGLNASILGLLLNTMFTNLGNLLFYVVDLLLDFHFYIVDFFTSLKYIELKFRSPSFFEIICYYLILLLFVNGFEYKRLKYNVKLFLMTWVSVALILFPVENKGFSMDVIDVGQGDAILVRDGNSNYLIDTGGSIFNEGFVSETITIPYLEKQGVERIDGLFISHYHEDHCEGLLYLLDRFNIGKVYLPYEADNIYFNNVIDRQIAYEVLNRGDVLKKGNLSFEVVWSDGKNSNENDNSLVFNMKYKNRIILFTGDMEESVENEILDLVEKVDIVKVPHHGSKTSSSLNLLKKIEPKYAIISVGENNSYGHPNQGVLNSYEEVGSLIYRTDQGGRIKVTIGEEVEISNYLDESFDYLKLFIYMIYFYILYIIQKLNRLYIEEWWFELQ